MEVYRKMSEEEVRKVILGVLKSSYISAETVVMSFLKGLEATSETAALIKRIGLAVRQHGLDLQADGPNWLRCFTDLDAR